MASLNSKIRIYLANNSKVYKDERKNYTLYNASDGTGDVIQSWNVSGLSKPTTSQLNALESDADTLEANNIVRTNRQKSYGDIGDQLDEIYKDIDAWKTRIKKVKDDNPKS
jgi:hypothetical protein